MLAWLKDLVAPIRKDDPRFGAIRYLRDAGFWEGRTTFIALGREVEVLVWGEAGGPAPEQYGFFDDLEHRYSALWPTILDTLESAADRAGVKGKE